MHTVSKVLTKYSAVVFDWTSAQWSETVVKFSFEYPCTNHFTRLLNNYFTYLFNSALQDLLGIQSVLFRKSNHLEWKKTGKKFSIKKDLAPLCCTVYSSWAKVVVAAQVCPVKPEVHWMVGDLFNLVSKASPAKAMTCSSWENTQCKAF